ncbi:hypothetical protein D8B26_006671 [Coccidioides posadasii str. Silveira]|uniref:superoxide dismutase n=3 Tax=Coccidioides posadasii TaxID=199306 RepID=Q307Q6_COCPS|nr:conserved hypothetical protein [Coccidioides posadasii C735 delta SOWgp]ABB36775.1 Cu/Zn superoxide dismutase-related protein [Coccidioides posadasii str. Silveira]KMM68032.1 cytosolic Cu/Zn superoxide dismutase [Coccidioides posadasii RMSCC 3488]EER28022.1 conserved hypothetical protein [Coccidioides posadasii C735 delta SOWgp]EFW23156.1 conserved hypothetical protein [Coccidioides posadasii str. Silveira]QVM12035.1 hypothetical protein D8B26_006671 [Coccidioides posadasii str. Silveira]|eukprot:XP_003070167.1 conserved hypothetical protein [Coccidioides posadasii C735 delta SOWgp]
MHAKSLLAFTSLLSAGFAAAQTGRLGDADVTVGNSPAVVYEAELLDKNNTNFRGTVLVSGSSDGVGVIYNVNFTGFPPFGGPFLYHVHDQPVPENGDCLGTLAHLDPYERGEMPKCDPSRPQTCQVGDLSGKFGDIEGVNGSFSFQQQYHDPYSSVTYGLGSFVGNRSIVVHFANTTRINCGNFTLKEIRPGSRGLPCNGRFCPNSPSGSMSVPVPTTTSPPTFEGDAAKVSVMSATGVLAALIGLLW